MSASLKSLLPQRHNTLIVIGVLFVLGTALGLYYFYYIPGNRQRLHQYGFRMLGAITKNIGERNSELMELYKNNISGKYRSTQTDHRDDIKDIEERLKRLPDLVEPSFIMKESTAPARSPEATLQQIRDNRLEYEIVSEKGIRAKVGLPVYRLVKHILSYRHELFESYLILKHDSTRGNIIYQEDSLGLDDRIVPDSILARKKGATFSQIADVSIQGIQYKLFSFPFTLGKEHLVLGGLIKASDYHKRLGSMPVHLVYPLIILLVLILISLPFLKIYLLGPYEQIRFTDLTRLGLAVFGGVTVITMIIIQLVLLGRGYMQASQELRVLSKQIERSMDEEVREIQTQLRFLDAAFHHKKKKADTDTTKPWMTVYAKGTKRYIPTFPDTGKRYYNFERVNWVDSTGIQLWRAQLFQSRAVRINVSDREYFTFFSQQYKSAGGEDAGVTVMAPGNSRSGGDFVINLVERSCNSAFLLLTISTKMYSLLNTVLPPGYGFCIIDNKGKVYIHSEANRSLKENFLDEADNAGPLIGAINSRQDTTLRNVHCYGKEHSVYIHPLSQRVVMHPVARQSYFLVTFYDNSMISPSNLRILMFSLVFTLLSSLLVVLWLLFNHGFSRRSLLYRDPLAAHFTWIIPRAEDSAIYRNGLWFMLAYLAALLSLGVFGTFFTPYVTFALGLVSPLNILILLYSYRIYSRSTGNISQKWKISLYLLLMLIYSLFICWRLELDLDPYTRGYTFWIFQGILMLLTAALWLAPGRRKEAGAGEESSRVQLWHYSIFVLLLALCLGVLPMMVFTWYAHNQEIEQSIKKRELSMAVALETRRPAILDSLLKFEHTDSLVKDYYIRRCWQQGIYGIRPCGIDSIPPWGTLRPQPLPEIERFYSQITGHIKTDFEEPSHYPVLNQASDDTWYWTGTKHTQTLHTQTLHYMPAPGVYRDNVQAFRITMPLPDPYLYLSSVDHIMVVVLSVLLVLGGLYGLIRSTVSRVFLLDFVQLFDTRSKECPEDAQHTDGDIKDMILLQRQKSAVFRSRWNRLSGRQRIILIDLVTDGMANYRNVMEISALTGEGQPLGICDGVIIVKDPVFRQFILEQRQTPETVILRKEFRAQSLWESLRTPLLVVIVVVGGFIFLTQEDISKKAVVLLTTLSSLLPLLPKLLGNFRGSAPPPKAGEG